MYKLENNVEWTENLKNAFKHGITRGKIKYTNDNNQEVVIDYDNGLKSFKLYDEKNVPSQGFIGQATARQVDLELINTININNLENKEFELFLGADYNNQTYYINYGKFIVNQAPENDLTNGIIKITAFDYMIKTNIPYVPVVTFPCTLKAVVDDICVQAGLELATLDFANADFIVDSNQFDGKTCREVLCHVGKCAFSWVRIGQDNKLYLDFEVGSSTDFYLQFQILKGDTFQQTSPSPNYPQDVKVVTGNNNILINNGNLGNMTALYNDMYAFNPRYVRQETVDNKDCIVFANDKFLLNNEFKGLQGRYKENTRYRINFDLRVYNTSYTSGYSIYINFYYTDGTRSRIAKNAGGSTWYNLELITDDNKTIDFIVFSYGNSAYWCLANLSITKYVEEETYTYKESQEQNYPITLIGKNRFDKAKEPDYIADAYATELATGIKVNNSIVNSFCRVGYVVGNTHELYNKTIRIATDAILSEGNESLFIISLASADLIQRTQKVNTHITTNGHVEASYTVVDDDENKVILVQLYANNAVHQTIGTYTEYNNLIITIDNEDMSYESYDNNIELCKIGNYQDYIYKNKNDGNWYKKELIGKTTDTSGSTSKTISDMIADDGFYSYYGGTLSNKTITYSSAIPGTNIIYYPKATPTDIQIIDTTLLNQLNDIYDNLEMYEEHTYIKVTSDNINPIAVFETPTETISVQDTVDIIVNNDIVNNDIVSDVAENITIDDYKKDCCKMANEYYGAINRVIYAESNIQGQEEKVEDTDDIALNGLHELTIYDNYFAYTTAKRQELIQAGTKLFGLKYMPIQQLDMVGLAYLDCKDKINVTTLDEETYQSIALNHIIEYNGAVKDSLTSETNSTTETNYKNTNAPINANSLAEIIIDRAMREIKMIVDQYVNFLHNKSGNNNIFIDGTRDGEGFITKFVIKGNTTYFTEDTITLITSEVVKNEEIAIMTEAEDSLLTEAGDVILGEPKTLYVDKVEIVLDDVLRSLVVDNTTYYDELQILQDGTIQIIRRIGVSTNQTLYLLDKEKVTILNQKYIVSSSEKGYYYFVEELDNLDYYAEYIIKNEYSDMYATEAYVNAGLDLKIDTNKLVSELNASADIIKLIGQRLIIQMQNFSLDETGYMSANAGQIAGFTMLQNRFYKDFKMLYTFTPEDVNLLMGYIHDYNSLSNGIENLYDLVHQGELNVLDVVRMIEIIHNEVENTSYIEGTVAIKSNDSNELIEITNNLNIDKTRIGIFTMYSYLVRADVIALTEVQTSGNVEIKGIILDKAKKKISVTDGTNETIILPTGITTPTLTQTSRATDKKDFAKLEKALEEVMNTEIYTYHLKSQNDDDKKHVGFVIGNGFKYSHLITAENDKKEEIGVDPYSMVSVLWKAVQEQQAQIEELKKEIKKLKGE